MHPLACVVIVPGCAPDSRVGRSLIEDGILIYAAVAFIPEVVYADVDEAIAAHVAWCQAHPSPLQCGFIYLEGTAEALPDGRLRVTFDGRWWLVPHGVTEPAAVRDLLYAPGKQAQVRPAGGP